MKAFAITGVKETGYVDVPEASLDPAAPAVQYAFRLGFDSVALNTSKPEHIMRNARYATAVIPEEFWKVEKP